MASKSKYRVQAVNHPSGEQTYLVVERISGEVDKRADRFLRSKTSGTQRTYSYRLAEYLSWRDAQPLSDDTVTLQDLERFITSLAETTPGGPTGVAVPSARKKPLSVSAQGSAATAIRGYYLSVYDHEKVNAPLREALLAGQITRYDPVGSGEKVKRVVPKNPLAPRQVRKKPRLLPDNLWDRLAADGVLQTARDRMIVTWLFDAGLRNGELCGLRFADLHLRANHPCMQSKHPHVHVVKRLDNPNRAKAKTSGPPEIGEDGIVRGGTIRRVSPEMLSTYWEYLTEDYHRVRALADHDMVLVVLEDGHLGDALTTKGLRDVVKAAGKRADLGLLRPHAFRHRWATDMLRSTGNSKMVAEAGGWGSTQTIEDTYAHLVDTPELEAALDRVWRKNPLA